MTNRIFQRITAIWALAVVLLFSSCDKDDPKPVNEEEVITTMHIHLVPEGGGNPIDLEFYDADGELGSTAPLITVSGGLKAETRYSAVVELENETATPPVNISQEVEEEGDEHIFCFDSDGAISVQYEDQDNNGLPIGLMTTWETGGPGTVDFSITLRHQPGTKTGSCPGGGDTDLEVTFNLVVD